LTRRTSSEGPETPDRPTRWISLSRACGLLGVNESTLRRWADAGHVRSFRTPGGHRRFAEDDLRALMAGEGRPGPAVYGSLGRLAMTRIRRRLHRGKSPSTQLYDTMDEDHREHMRPLGRRLVALVSEYLARGTRRAKPLEEARQIGQEYGREIAARGISMLDAIRAFTFFRKSLDDAAIEIAHRSNLSAEEAVEVWELMSGLADQILLAMVGAYEEAREAAVGSGKGR
jgi:excisionase family DNA binding protein